MRQPKPTIPPEPIRMFLVPCGCGVSFSVAPDYDRRGTSWSRYLICPNCGKRHDPKIGYSNSVTRRTDTGKLISARLLPDGGMTILRCRFGPEFQSQNSLMGTVINSF